MLNSTTTCNPADASGTITCATEYGQSTSTDPSYYNGFTYGEIVLTTLCLFIFLVVSYAFLWFRLKGVKINQ